jgi:sialate O-acetylesterase
LGVSAPATAWEKVKLPGYMESFGPAWRDKDGEVVYRKEFKYPLIWLVKISSFRWGRVDETEETFFNGESVGKSKHWILARGHVIPGRLVKAGKNTLAIRTWDEGIHGGISRQPRLVLPAC